LGSREAFGAFVNEHHVRAIFEDLAREPDWIADAPQNRYGTCAQGGAIHNDCVTFDVAIESEMRAEASIENGIVFENDDSGFDGIERRAALIEDGPACGESAFATAFACVDRLIGNVPSAAVNNERRFHEE
jgi:hypothetical protein